MRNWKRIVVSVLAPTIFFSHLQTAFAAAAFVSECEQKLAESPRPALRLHAGNVPDRFGRTYFIYTRLSGDGSLGNIIKNLPLYKSMGIENLWISPIYPQSIMEMPYVDEHGQARVTHNTHYYWVRDHGRVAAELAGDVDLPGIAAEDRGEYAFRELLRQAKAMNINIIFDAVFDHFGYGESFVMDYEREDGTKVHKVIYSNDRRYFRANFDGPYLQSRYNLLDTAQSKELAIEYMDEIATLQWDQWLPVLNHHNEEVFEMLYNKHRKFVDMGVTIMRLDAFKHMPIPFLIRMVNALGEYSQRKHNRRMTFLAEHLITSENYIPIQAVTEIFDREVIWADVFFIDFPKAYTARRLAYDPNYKMKDFARFIKYRYDPVHTKLLSQMISDVENHDFLFPVSSSQYNRMLVFAVSEFFSNGGTILFHGGENLDRSGDARVHIPDVNEQGEIGQMLEYWHRLLLPIRASGTKTTFLIDNDDEKMIAEHTLGHESFMMVVSRTSAQENLRYIKSQLAKDYPDAFIAYDVVYAFSSGHNGYGHNHIDLRASGAVAQEGYQSIEVKQQHAIDITTYGQTVALIRARITKRSDRP